MPLTQNKPNGRLADSTPRREVSWYARAQGSHWFVDTRFLCAFSWPFDANRGASVGDSPAAHLLAACCATNDAAIHLTRVSLYMGRAFAWTGHDGERRDLAINGDTFRTVAELCQFNPQTVFDVIFIALPNVPLFDESLQLLSIYTDRNTVILVDAETGVGLDCSAYRTMSVVSCLSLCADCNVILVKTSEFQLINEHQCEATVSYSLARDQEQCEGYLKLSKSSLTAFINVLSGVIRIAIDRTRTEFVSSMWTKCLRVLSFETCAILFDEPDYEKLATERNLRTVVQNLMEEVIMMAKELGEEKWCSQLVGKDIKLIAKLLNTSSHDSLYAVVHGLENYIPVMMFQLLLLSDELGIHLPALENNYPMLLRKISSVRHSLVLPVAQFSDAQPSVVSGTGSDGIPPEDDLHGLFFDAEQIPILGDAVGAISEEEAFTKIATVTHRLNHYRDYDRTGLVSLERSNSTHSSLEGMDILGNSLEFAIDPGPNNLRAPKSRPRRNLFRVPEKLALKKTPPNSGMRDVKPKRKAIHFEVSTRQSDNERHRAVEEVFHAMTMNGLYTTTTERYGWVSHDRSQR